MNKLIFLLCAFIMATSTNLRSQDYERYVHLLDTTIYSTNLGYEKSLTITVPFEWQEGMEKSYPVVVIFDRQNPRSHQFIIKTIDYLTSNEQMPSCVIVGIASKGVAEVNGETIYPRYLETLLEGQKDESFGAENERFIFDEILPLMEEEFQASKFRTLIGHSRYGYFTTYLFAKRYNDLNAVVSLSPFMFEKGVNLVDTMEQAFAHSAKNTKYYRYGVGNDYPEQFMEMDSMLQATEHPSFNTKGALFPTAEHNATPGLIIGPALYGVFEFWAGQQQSFFDLDIDDFDPENSAVEAHYGHRLPNSLGVLNGMGWQYYNEGQFEKAIKAWKIFAQEYPNFSEVYLYLADAQKQLGLDYSRNLEQFQTSFEHTKFYLEDERKELEEEFNLFDK